MIKTLKYTAAILWNDLPDAFWKIEEKIQS